MTEYAGDQDFPVRAMYYAKKALVEKGILPRTRSSCSARFEQAQVIEPSIENQCRITLPNGMVVEFTGSFDEQTRVGDNKILLWGI